MVSTRHHPARANLPQASAGMVIGLLGGSFDPPHRGHLHISTEALKRFGLDRIWWLVSPGNPLKPNPPAPLKKRLLAARDLVADPRIIISDIEARLGTRYTAETLAALVRLYPGVRFVWLMGADNLAQFHLWEDWDQIMQMLPIGIIARPGSRAPGRLSKAAERFARFQWPGETAHHLACARPPAWCFINIPMRTISSTEIRAKGGWDTDAGA